MFKIDTLTVKNFMSVGNTTQAVDFNRNDLTLVLGENLDTGGGDAGSRRAMTLAAPNAPRRPPTWSGASATHAKSRSRVLRRCGCSECRLANLVGKGDASVGLVCTDIPQRVAMPAVVK